VNWNILAQLNSTGDQVPSVFAFYLAGFLFQASSGPGMNSNPGNEIMNEDQTNNHLLIL
jgi:hypothetical protein